MSGSFTANEVRTESCKQGQLHRQPASDMLNAFADLLEAREKAVPVAWRTFDGEGNYDYRDYENNEHYRDWYVSRNGAKYANWVEPLYSHPTPSDAERLADETALRHGWAYSYSGSNLYGDDGELQDNAAFPHIDWLRDSVQELHQKVAKRGAAKLATHPAQAQPPAASVTVDAVMRVIDGQRRLPYCSIDEKQAFRNELEAALAAQENSNG